MEKVKNRTDLYWIGLGVAVLSITVGILFFQSRKSSAPGIEVDWQLLQQADYTTNTYSDELKKLDGEEVKIPGFMVPLEDNMRTISEFLLVPSPQACVHVPPPPPNQMVFVKVADEEKFKMMYGPVWIYGKLKLEPMKSMYGEAFFNVVATRIEPYQ